MKHDLTTATRFREPWEVRRPPPAMGPNRAVGTLNPRTDSAHLVLTNDADGREGPLLGVAGHLAERAGTSVRVAHLYREPPAGELENLRRLAPTDHGGPAAESCDRLSRSARTLAARTGLPVASELLTGPALADYARGDEFDLVTAATGPTWLSLWRGGVWSRVARVRPVVVVGPAVSGDWPAESGPPREVVVLLDGTAGAERILAPAAHLCRLLDAPLALLHARPPEAAPAVGCHRYLLDVAGRVRREVPAVRMAVATAATAEAALAAQYATGAIVALCAPAASRLTAWCPGRLAVQLLHESTAPVLFYRPTL